MTFTCPNCLKERSPHNYLCMDCIIKNDNEPLQKQINHPFYKRTDEYRKRIKQKTLEKAAAKYPEPFDPQSWTIEELADHAMAENYDQSNYINGLFEKAKRLEEELEKANHAIIENCELRKRIVDIEEENEILRVIAENTKKLWETPFFQSLMKYAKKLLENETR